MFYKGKGVLVLGGAGLTGQSLIPKLLEQGACVRATQYRNPVSISHKNLETVTCDLRDPERMPALFKGMDLVFLCAGIVRGAKGLRDQAAEIMLYNLQLQSKLLYWAWKSKAQRCSFISSSYVYPHTGRPNTEEEGFQGDPWKPANYGMGWYHRYLETLCRHFHLMGSTQYAVIRPTVLYGPHDHFDLEDGHVLPASVVKGVRRMDPYEVWGAGQEVRCFTYVEDFVEGLLRCVEHHATAEPLNLCAAESSTVERMIRIILDHLDFHPKLVFRSDKPTAIPYKVSDPSRARQVLGWEARVSLEEGLRRTVDWYRESVSKVGVTASR